MFVADRNAGGVVNIDDMSVAGVTIVVLGVSTHSGAKNKSHITMLGPMKILIKEYMYKACKRLAIKYTPFCV